MKLFKNIVNKIRRSPKKALFVSLLVTAVAVPAVVFAGWGPERPVYDFSVACDPTDGNPYDRCGSLEGPVFNSFINTPTYGDERDFVTMAEVKEGQHPGNASYSNDLTAEEGKEYWVRTFVHNNANESLNTAENDYRGIAQNTRVKLLIAEGQANGVEVMSHVSADNASPSTVWDGADLNNANQRFSVDYVDGSAILVNDQYPNGTSLSDSINSDQGVPIGFDNMDGEFEGCFDFAAYVYVKVRVEAPDLRLEKLVRHDGETSDDWSSSIHANRGNQVEYLIDYSNTGTDVSNNIVIRDDLPSEVTLVPGSVRWIDVNQPSGGTPVPDEYVFQDGGFGVGNYGPNGGGYVFFEATINDEVDACVANNVAFAWADGQDRLRDEAQVVIDDCYPEEPLYVCDDLAVESLGGREYEFTATHSNNDLADFMWYRYNFGDDSDVLRTDHSVVNHTYSVDGTYTASVTPMWTVDGETVSDTGPQCMVEIKPSSIPEIPDTGAGAGAVAGLFAGFSALGTAAYQVVARKRK